MGIVKSAINHIGAAVVAKKFRIRISAVIRMRDLERLPRTELAGLTNYAQILEDLSAKKFKAEELIAETRKWWEARVAGQQREKYGDLRANG